MSPAANVPPFTMSSPAFPLTVNVSTPVCEMSDPSDENGVNVTVSAEARPEMINLSVPDDRSMVKSSSSSNAPPAPELLIVSVSLPAAPVTWIAFTVPASFPPQLSSVSPPPSTRMVFASLMRTLTD